MRTGIAIALVTLAGPACLERGEVLGPEPVGTSTPPVALASDVSAGERHTLAVSRGRLYAWGANDTGQLGLGDTDERHLPEAVPSTLRFVRVAAANAHSCAIDDLSEVYCWGENARGQLGRGDRTPSLTPVRVSLPAPAATLSARFNHTCALLRNAALYCWGQNDEGQLGQDDPGVGGDPTVADGLEPLPVGGAEWVDVGAGDGHTCAVRLDGALFCWGRNTSHQLGPDPRIQVRVPIQVDADLDWLEVDAGQQHTLALKRNASLYVWGDNVAYPDEGFPLGIDVAQVDVPTPLGLPAGAAAISTEVFHSCSVSHAGELHCWGRNIEGQLGTGDLEIRREPTFIRDGIASVSTSWFTTAAITVTGSVVCTGENDFGQLGLGHLDRMMEFTEVVLPAP